MLNPPVPEQHFFMNFRLTLLLVKGQLGSSKGGLRHAAVLPSVQDPGAADEPGAAGCGPVWQPPSTAEVQPQAAAGQGELPQAVAQ